MRPRRIAVLALGLGVAISVFIFIALIRPATQVKNGIVTDNKKFSEFQNGSVASKSDLNRLQKQYGTLPLSFEPNIGQFEPNSGQTDARVKFVSRGRGYTLFLTPTEAVLALRKAEATGTKQSISGATTGTQAAEARVTGSAVLRMKLIGANPEAVVSGREKLPGKSNYFIGNDPKKWRTSVPTYASVSYQNVYPGVDLIHYGNQQQLEHDFIVNPGADPKAIALGFPSADKLTLDPHGNLLIGIGGEEVMLQAPVIYQETDAGKKNIDGHYVFKGSQQIGFEVAAYDSHSTLVIDPTLVYSTYLGGSTGNDQGNSIAVDSTGNAYIVGTTASTNFPTTASAFQKTYSGGATDVFVSKLNSTGSALVYSTYLGGTVGDQGMAIAVDSSGNAYITGQAGSNNFPTTAGVVQTAFGGSTSDAFVTKLNSTGSALTYSTYLGGSGLDIGLDIAVDSSGNAYVTGQTQSPNFTVSATAFQKTLSGASDIFVSKLNSTGTALTYSTYLGGSATEMANAISVDSAGNAYIAGESSSLNYPIAGGPVQATFGGGVSNAVVTKLNSTGSALTYSTYLGGNGTDIAHGLAVDSSGNAYVCGSTTSANFPTTAGALQASFAGGATSGDAFVSKLNPAGTALVYSTFLGGSGDEICNGLAINSSGNAFVAGYTKSSNFPTAGSPAQSSFGGNTDAYLTELNSTGTALIYSTYLGGSGDDEGTGVIVDSAGNPYIVGFTNSSNFPTAGNRFQSSLAGGYDGFVAKYNFGNPFSFVQAKASGSTFGKGTTTFISPNLAGDTIVVGIDYGDPVGNITSVTDSAGNTYAKSCSVSVTSTAGHLEVWHAQNIKAAATNTVTVTPNGNLGLQWAIGEYGGASTSGPIIDSCNGQLGSGGGTDAINSGTTTTTKTDLIIGWGRVSGGSINPGTNFSYGIVGVDGQLLEHRLGVTAGTLSATESDSSASHWGMFVVAFLPAGPSPAVSLSAPSLTFANQAINTTSAGQSVTLTNTGNSTLNISSISVTGTNSGDYTQTNNCASSISVNGTCTINATFKPTAAGARTAAVTITDNASGGQQSITLTGTGVTTPAVSLSTTSLTFASQTINTTSAALPVTLTNTGTGALTITSIGITGTNSAEYTQTNTCGNSVAVNGTCTISVKFAPTSLNPGTPIAAVTITDNALDSPESINLSGTVAGAPAPVVSLSSASLTFAGQTTNTTSAAQTVTLTNPGNSVLNITSIGLTGANIGDYAETTTCGSTVAANNGNCTISVTFTPTVIGARTAAVTITDNAAGNPHSFTLNGTGVAPASPVVITPNSANFGSVAVGSSSGAIIINIKNTGAAFLTLNGEATTGDFSVTSFCGSGLSQGFGCDNWVKFTPTAPGVRTGTLVFTDSAVDNPQVVNLTGTGTSSNSPVVNLSVPSLTFTNQQVNTTSGSQTVTLTNTGNAALNISSLAVTGANSGDYVQTNTCGATVAANNGSCTISVTFTPTVAGTRTAAVTITDNAAGSPHSFTLSGTGSAAPAPIVNLSVSSLTFASQTLNTTSGSQTVTLTNTGNAALNISNLAITGANSGDYAQTNTCGSSVAANNGNCTISVTFTPTVTGSSTAAVTITDNATGSPHTITLNGTGTPVPAPVVSLSVSSLTFPNQSLNTTSASQSVTLTNTGNAVLNITSIGLVGANSGDYAQTTTCGSTVAANNGNCTISVTFTPTAAGARAAAVTINDNATGTPHTISLNGTGVAVPVVSLSGSSLTFASQTINTTSGSQSVTLTNTGTAVLNITSIGVTGANGSDFVQANTCGSSVAANNGNCTISVTFTPTATGARAAAVTITDNAAGSPHTITMNGTGTPVPAPVVSLSASSLSFANQSLNTTSASQTVTLTNTGNAVLNITSIGLTGANSGDYAQTTTCGSTVAANNGNCSISVTFTPTATGARAASVTIADDATGTPHSIAINGTGVAAPIVSLSSPSLTFTNQQINTVSPAQTVTLTNTGNAVLNITSIAVTGANSGDYSQTNTCGNSVAANNGNCTISVTFTPTATGARAASVTISDNAAGSPHAIALTGTGTPAPAPVVSMSAPSLTFVGQQVGTTSPAQSVTLTNTGNAVLNISSLAITGANSGDYAQTNTCGSSVAANNGNCTISVTFAPAAAGSRNASVTVADNAAGTPHSITLNGTGLAAPVVNLSTSSLTFASQNLGTPSAAQSVTLTNTGNAALSITSIGVTGVNSGDYSQTNTCGNSVAANNGTCSISVKFTPIGAGSRTAAVTITDNAAGSPHAVSLNGTGSSSPVVITPSSNDFGSQAVGSTTHATIFNFKNVGSPSLAINSITTTGDFALTSFCGSGLSQGFGCDIWVTFSPTAPGVRSGTLIFNDSSPDSPQVIPLTGTGTSGSPAPAVSLSPTSLIFASQQVNTTSGSQAVTLTNTGNAVLNITGISVTGANIGDFTQLNSCGNSVAANNGSCTITVTFTPAAAGARAAAVTITDNAAGSPHSFALSGTGASAPAPVVSLSSSNLTFASQTLNTTSGSQTVTLTNTGNATLNISSLAITGANSGDYAQTNTCGSSVAANNGNCTISVTFTPTATGSRTAAVTITDNAAGTPHTITLSGTGANSSAPVVSLSTSSLTFASQTLNTTSGSQTVTLTNTGNAVLNITGLGVTGANAGDFAQTNSCGSSVAANNGSCTISVTFTPTAAGARAAAVSITDNATGSPHSITLSGTGSSGASTVQVTPTSFNFGTQTVGTTSGALDVGIRNLGAAFLTLNSITVTGDFILTNFCGSGLSQGYGCDVWVQFKPTATGVRTGTIVFNDSAPDSPHVVTLTGTGN